jgi:RNA polymerase sigma factor (sigma-70 family)
MRFGILMRSQSDDRLVQFVRAGHDGAFDEVVRRYREPIARYCRRLVGDGRADEAAQQAFVDAWSALSRGTTVRDLRPWLYRVAFHAAIRPVAARAEVELPDDESAAHGRDDLDSRIETHTVLAAVAALPERQRDAIVLTIRGFASDEVGRSLGLTDGAARQLLHRARATLRAGATAITPWHFLARAFGGQSAEVAAGGAGATGLAVAALKVSATVLVSGAAIGGGAVAVQDIRSHLRPADAQAGVARSATSPGESTGAAPEAPTVTLVADAFRAVIEEERHRRRHHAGAPDGSGAAADDTASQDASADDPSADDPAADDASSDDPPPDDPPADDPPADDPPAEDPPPDDPPPDDPPLPDPVAAPDAAPVP